MKSSILSSLGIPTVVDLPGVGENFQDQPNTILVYNGTTPEALETGAITPYAAFLTAADLFGHSELSALASRTLDSLPTWSTQVAVANNGRVSAAALERIFRLYHDLIFAKNVTVVEIIPFAQPGQFGSAWWPLLPFSRGSVHLGGEDTGPDPVSLCSTWILFRSLPFSISHILHSACTTSGTQVGSGCASAPTPSTLQPDLPSLPLSFNFGTTCHLAMQCN